MSGNCAVFDSSGVDYRAVIILPCNGVASLDSIKLCHICHISCYGSHLRRPSIIKCIVVLCSCCLGRCFALIGRCGTVVKSICLECLAVTVHPCYGVLINRSLVGSLIGCLACYGGKSGSPAVKGIGVLSICGLSGCFACVYGSSTVVKSSLIKNCRAVLVYEGDFIAVYSFGVGSGVCNGFLHLGNFCVPAVKGVGVLSSSGLSGRLAIILGHFTVGYLARLENRAVFVYELNGVLINRFSIYSGVGYLTCYGGHLR